MGIQFIITKTRKYYEESIKPLIEKGYYGPAGFQTKNLNRFLRSNEIQITQYSSGDNFINCSLSLEEELISECKKPERAMKNFEAFLAQLELSIKSNNKPD